MITTALDLFAGAGGWDVAAAELGIDALGVENMKEARATRDAAGLTTIHDDVWTLHASPVSHYFSSAQGLITSPPCQTFSQAGKGAGRKALDTVLDAIDRQLYAEPISVLRKFGEEVGDARTALVLTPMHFAFHGDHEWIAWEQVPTVLPVWEACAEKLRDWGYSVWTGNLQAEQYGVPQTRKRAILIASRTREVGMPTPTHSRYYPRDPKRLDEGVLPWVSMAEALNAHPDFVVRSNYGTGGDPARRGERSGDEPSATVKSKIDRNRVFLGAGATSSETAREPAHTITGQGSAAWRLRSNAMNNATARNLDHPAPTITGAKDFGERVWESRDDLPEWASNRPSTTVVGSFKPEIVAAPGYRTTVSRQDAPDSVRVTVQEAGVLQSFPADYPWQGAKGKQYLQVGNAIPVGLAKAVLKEAIGHD